MTSPPPSTPAGERVHREHVLAAFCNSLEALMAKSWDEVRGCVPRSLLCCARVRLSGVTLCSSQQARCLPPGARRIHEARLPPGQRRSRPPQVARGELFSGSPASFLRHVPPRSNGMGSLPWPHVRSHLRKTTRRSWRAWRRTAAWRCAASTAASALCCQVCVCLAMALVHFASGRRLVS